MRYTFVLLALLVFAVVLATAGEGGCGECLHGCCTRSGTSRSLGSMLRSIIRAFSSLTRAIPEAAMTTIPVAVGSFILGIPTVVGVSPLRI